MTTTLDVSAEFGGPKAAEAALPHFRVLKAALKGRSFEGFPFPQMSFILRVDGEVGTYGPSGPGRPDVDRRGRHVSVDIGISHHDRARGGDAELAAFVAGAIVASVDLLIRRRHPKLAGTDWEALRAALEASSAAYRASFTPAAGDADGGRPHRG